MDGVYQRHGGVWYYTSRMGWLLMAGFDLRESSEARVVEPTGEIERLLATAMFVKPGKLLCDGVYRWETSAGAGTIEIEIDAIRRLPNRNKNLSHWETTSEE